MGLGGREGKQASRLLKEVALSLWRGEGWVLLFREMETCRDHDGGPRRVESMAGPGKGKGEGPG